MTPRKSEGGPRPVVTVRLPVELIEALDSYAEEVSPPGLSLSRSDAIQSLLTIGLEAHRAGKRRRKK